MVIHRITLRTKKQQALCFFHIDDVPASAAVVDSSLSVVRLRPPMDLRPEIGFRHFSSSLALVCMDYKMNFPAVVPMDLYNRPAGPEGQRTVQKNKQYCICNDSVLWY
jgi:hypothetical protein